MRECRRCGRAVEDDFRFCPGCGTPLRLKVVEHFAGVKELDDGWLRVSVYLTRPQHVRLSLWRGDRATAAMSLPPHEAERLATFLRGLARRPEHATVASLRRSVLALRDAFR